LADLSLTLGCFEFVRCMRDEGALGTAAGESSSTFGATEELQLGAEVRAMEASLWRRRLRDGFAGLPLQVAATQFFMSRVIKASAARQAAAARAAAAAALATVTAAAAPAAPSPPSRFPYDACRTREVSVGGGQAAPRLETLQAPALTLRASNIIGANNGAAASARQQAQLLLQQLKQQGK
jgi:hypothetical protein